MSTVIITSVSASAAKRAFNKVVTTNDVILSSPTHATGNALSISIQPEGDYTNAENNAVVLTSSYFNEVSLLEFAQKVAGRGTVTVKA
jgi:hypothetical protein